MGKGDPRTAAQASLAWVARALASYADGVHRLGDPAYVLDSEIPVGLAETYRMWDGMELFHESLELVPSRRLRRDGRFFAVGHVHGDDLLVAPEGGVWRRELDTGEVLHEGTTFDRWLAGYVAAEQLLYEADGEFRDDVLDDSGELLPDVALRREEAVLARDRRAPAPRWRLARELSRLGRDGEARDHLERVVEVEPAFGWAWFDLARISESRGELHGAMDELEAAATADPDGPYSGFFWSQMARIARMLGAEDERERAAREALRTDPDLVRNQVDGAREHLDAGNVSAARELAESARAVAPTDLAALDVLRIIESRHRGREPE